MWSWPFPDISNALPPPGPSSGGGGAAMVSNPLGTIATPTAQSAGQPMQLPGAVPPSPQPQEPQQDFGVQDSQYAALNTLGQLGPLLMAAGQRMTPQERAKLLAGMSPIIGNMGREAQQSAQTRLIQQKTQEMQGASQRRSEAIASALNDPSIPGQVKMLLKADPDKGFEYLAKLMTPIQKQDQWQMHSNPMTGETYLFNVATGETKPYGGQGGEGGGGAPGPNSVSTAETANGIMMPPDIAANPIAKKRWLEEHGKDAANRQQELSKDAELAQRTMPNIQRALSIWDELQKDNAIGPVVGNEYVRVGEKFLSPLFPGIRKDEGLREEFDTLLKDLQLGKARENAGQGPVSDFERKLYSLAAGGSLSSVDPARGRASLDNLLRALNEKIKEGQDARLGRMPDLTPNAGQPQTQPRLPDASRPVATNPRTGQRVQLSADGTRWEPI